jgi:hypothetical protein
VKNIRWYAPLLAETFTDPEAHAGTCYKAAGWEPLGQTIGFERHRCDFFAWHDHPKRLWLEPLDPGAKEKLCAPQLSARHAPALTVGAATRCALKTAQRYSLKEALRQVPDPRRKQGQRYPLAPCLVILALGLLAGKVDLAQIQRFGTRLSQRQRQALGFWPKKGTRFYPVPTYTVLRDLLLALDLDALAGVLTRWLQGQAGRLPASLALDGKTIRDQLGCIVSLVEHEDGAPVAVIAAPNKGHELPAAQKLLRSASVNLLDCVVHRRPAPLPERNRPDHHPREGRRLCPGRQRQPTHRAAEHPTETGRGHPPFAQTEPSRGRIETRAVSRAAIEPDALPFPGARQVFDTRNTTTFKKDGNSTGHTRYSVTSLTTQEAHPSHLAALARGQWSVENPNHWRRDALWGEDRRRLRNKNAACALALLRTALLRPVLRGGWGTTREVFERVAARPSQGLELLAKRSFP